MATDDGKEAKAVKMVKVIAVAAGYMGRYRERGDTFVVPEGTKAPWFVLFDEQAHRVAMAEIEQARKIKEAASRPANSIDAEARERVLNEQAGKPVSAVDAEARDKLISKGKGKSKTEADGLF